MCHRGGGLRQINTCRKVPLQVIFLDGDILLWCLNSQLVHGWKIVLSFKRLSIVVFLTRQLVRFETRHLKKDQLTGDMSKGVVSTIYLPSIISVSLFTKKTPLFKPKIRHYVCTLYSNAQYITRAPKMSCGPQGG